MTNDVFAVASASERAPCNCAALTSSGSVRVGDVARGVSSRVGDGRDDQPEGDRAHGQGDRGEASRPGVVVNSARSAVGRLERGRSATW